MDRSKQYNCQFELTLDIMGGKWKPIILYYIHLNKIARHSELVTTQLVKLIKENSKNCVIYGEKLD